MSAAPKKFDLYVIGNAMVDMEWRVKDSFLDEINLPKGTAIFPNPDEQEKIIAKLPPCEMKFSGGSGANTALTVKSLGADVFLSCHAAADEGGDFFEQSMHEAGVETSLQHTGARLPGDTATCLIFVTEDAERSMCGCLGSALDLSVANIVPDAITSSGWIYIEGYQAASYSATKAVRVALEIAKVGDVKRALTLSDPGLVGQFRTNIDHMLERRIDLLFCNEAEAFAMFATEDMAVVRRRIIELAECCVITRDSRGCICYDGSNWHEVPTTPVAAIDTTGAGDVFAGFFLHALKEGKDFVTASKLGHRAAGVVISQFGARLHADQYQDLLAR